MKATDFKKLWAESGEWYLKQYKEKHGTDTIPFNTIYPEIRADGSTSFHLVYYQPTENNEEEKKDSKKPEQLKEDTKEEEQINYE